MPAHNKGSVNTQGSTPHAHTPSKLSHMQQVPTNPHQQASAFLADGEVLTDDSARQGQSACVTNILSDSRVGANRPIAQNNGPEQYPEQLQNTT